LRKGKGNRQAKNGADSKRIRIRRAAVDHPDARTRGAIT
jgi:hypothetical protein